MTAQSLYTRLFQLKADLLARGFLKPVNTKYLHLIDLLLRKLHKAGLKEQNQ